MLDGSAAKSRGLFVTVKGIGLRRGHGVLSERGKDVKKVHISGEHASLMKLTETEGYNRILSKGKLTKSLGNI